MAFEGLSERLEAAFKRLKSKGSLNEADVRAAMRDVRMALLEADVSYKVAKDFTAKVTESYRRGCYGEPYSRADGHKDSQRRAYRPHGRHKDPPCHCGASADSDNALRSSGRR